MGLQVWLPLNGNLDNNGLSNITITNSEATVDNNGKIGKCYSFNGTSSETTINGIDLSGCATFSICVWLCPTNTNNVTAAVAFSKNTYWQFVFYNKQIDIRDMSTGTTGTRKSYTMGDFPAGVWTHVAITYDRGEVKIYRDGVLYSTNNTGGTSFNVDTFAYKLGRANGESYRYNGKINDFRIYDHVLSLKEIHDISKGLILHYKLDGFSGNGVGGTNLIANGWGGTDNWEYTESPYVSSDVPSSPAGITNSYTKDNTTKDYVELIPDHSYTISGYVKKNSSSASSCYLSLIPYDIDKLRITSVQQSDYFRTASLTTLSQDLKSGDTIVHLTDASGWANPSTYQYYLAIFGYKDSTGYVYPDLVYTRRVYTFGTTTDKSNLDINNNQVTLLSAYSGKTIPAGTSVCLSGAGSTYYYPSIISASSATDWTLLTKTFIPKSVNYLKAAKYVKFTSLGTSQWIAGITLIDNTAEPIIKDVSGYNNDGTIVGTLSTEISGPRYNNCTRFTNSNYIAAGKGGKSNDKITVAWWGYMDNWTQYGRAISCTESGGWNFENNGSSYMRFSINISGTYCFGTDNLTLSQIGSGWHHFAATYDKTNICYYRDGNLISSSTPSVAAGNDIRYYANNGIFIAAEAKTSTTTAGSPYFNGKLSDIRIYATALSADDILELYNTSAFIDNHGNLDCFDIKEIDETQSNILKNGEVDSYNFMEVHPYLYLPAGSSVDSGLYYNAGDTCKAETIIKYSGGSGRDLMGYSASGGGYWGVTANGTWEPHGTFTYTNSDISVVNHISYTFYSATEHGTYVIGKLANTYSVRNKYIYRVRLYRNGILERDLHPLIENSVCGLFDMLNGVFYPSSGSGVTVGYEEEDNIAKIYKNHIKANQIIEI